MVQPNLKHHRSGGVGNNNSTVKGIVLCLISYAIGFFSGAFFQATGEESTVTLLGQDMSKNTNGHVVNADTSLKDKKNGLILPLERTEMTKYLETGEKMTDAYTYFHNYMKLFGIDQTNSPKDFTTLPSLHIWPAYFEAYHNHWQRYRGKQVVFMEIGVQSGGKIPLLRDYFGPGLTYVGVDINQSTKKFESADWIHIEIGSSEDPKFLEELKKKYPKVDLFLDDGGHTMNQQRVAMKEMFQHVAHDGVYMIEDLSTSWSEKFGGYSYKDSRDAAFLENTMVGLVHRTMDWYQAGWVAGTWQYHLPSVRYVK
jgi:hypothetical protein